MHPQYTAVPVTAPMNGVLWPRWRLSTRSGARSVGSESRDPFMNKPKPVQRPTPLCMSHAHEAHDQWLACKVHALVPGAWCYLLLGMQLTNRTTCQNTYDNMCTQEQWLAAMVARPSNMRYLTVVGDFAV